MTDGLLTIADLKGGSPKACTLHERENRPVPRHDSGMSYIAPSAPLRAHRGIIPLDLAIQPEAIVDLCDLGWLDPRRSRNPTDVADAVIDLVNEALALGLRPE